MTADTEVTGRAMDRERRIAGLTADGWRKAVMALILAAAVALPFGLGSFQTFQVTLVLIYAIAILGLNILTGFNGQFSLGHSAFFAIGAYTSAILMDRYEMTSYLTIPIAGGFGFVAGFLFGFPALRLSGLYLALATFALSVATPQLLKYNHFEEFTGGVQGINLLKDSAPFDLPFSVDQWWYFVTLAIALLCFWMARNLVHSRTGRAIMAIRDNPIAAATMGVNTALYKTLTFGVSAFLTAVAGALSAIVVEYVAPDSFTFLLSVYFLIGLVVGGVGWIPGAVIGGAFVLYVPNLAEGISTGLAGVLFGVIILLVIYLMPSGASGLVRLAVTRLQRGFDQDNNKA
ncbi:branched-chain amino acid ABC transporter permease [Thalassobaculum fulvum]|uniref:Branched-chain amino acid ABC transporter permease n=1 Tax=Thalassobaculum fulvum TaxID=1633335 RepID=A0A919CNE1_9PROT|nr:branched-chain amino acid ABC transporter permease [Thalassobaculum fulvum]GHD44518.1 branched-chain amino acid ABC transporter permease [Thalassobaculum fulvum]